MITLPVTSIRNKLVESVSSFLELNYADSEITVDHLIRCEQYGKSDHGLTRIPYLIRSGVFGPYKYKSSPVMDLQSPGRIFVDGSQYLGYPIISHIIKLGCRLACENSSCIITTKSVYPSGALLDWAQMALENKCGIILMAGSPARVTFPGGREPVVGTNPLCIGLPSSNTPFIADFSSSAITHGMLLQSRNEGIKLPPCSAIDAEGNPCTDGKRLAPSKGSGAILPFGNSHKSFALGMAIEILSSLGGNKPGQSVPDGHGIFGIILGSDLINNSTQTISSWLNSLNDKKIRVPGFQSFQRLQKFRKSQTVEISDKLYKLIAPYIN